MAKLLKPESLPVPTELLEQLVMLAENDCQSLARDHEDFPDIDKAKDLRGILSTLRAARKILATSRDFKRERVS